MLLAVEGTALVARAQNGSATGRWPLAAIAWPERTRHGQRVVQLHGGGTLQVADAVAFDAWRSAHVGADSWVVRVQQSWRATLVAVAVLVLLVGAGWRWGVPLAAQGVLLAVPTSVDEAVGEAALRSIPARWLQPSALPAARQAQLRDAFAGAVAAAWPHGDAPRWSLDFHAAGKDLGPNAFALPGGHLIVTDALVALLHGSDDTLVGVLAHELAHVQHRHGMRALVQVGLLGAVSAVALGDFSTLLAGVPVLLAQLDYSRAAERQADADAARVLRASGRSPAVMVLLFERLRALRDRGSEDKGEGAGPQLPIALASHPLDDERLRFFRDAAAR